MLKSSESLSHDKLMSDDRPLLERSMVTLSGDDDRWYHHDEVETATRRQINAVTVVNNTAAATSRNRASTASMAVRKPGWTHAVTFNGTSFASAKDMAALGLQVEDASAFPRRCRRWP
jgi:hypothetical protein